jgi:tRNA pseudouridine55 synthase
MLGFLNIDKPAGMTAHDVVQRVRRALKIKRVGHGGTLDPMATGVLPVALGKACRLLQFLPGDKTYLAEILLGTSTDTDDIEGEVLAESDRLPSAPAVVEALSGFIGTLAQVPPTVSAVHVGGERLYKLAREGRAPENVPARQVVVHSIEILDVALPVVQARIACGAGTYIRAIARDLGQRLGCGACLRSLRRERAGPFAIAEAIPLDELTAAAGNFAAGEHIIPAAAALGLPSLELSAAETKMLIQGREVPLAGNSKPALAPVSTAGTEPARLSATLNGELVAVCRVVEDRLRPEVVVADAS